MTRAPFILVFVWLVSGAGAVGGSILGNAAGGKGLFAGALLGGTLAAAAAAWVAVRFGWIQRQRQRPAAIGAALGFLIAAPIAALNLHTPVVPVLACALTGVGALIGAHSKSGTQGA